MLIKSNRGFTLVESLVVLLVISVFMFIGSISVKKLSASIERNNFITQLESDLYYAQSYAMNRHESVLVQFYPYYNQYLAVSKNNNKTLFDRKLPVSIEMLNGGTFTSYMILPDGNISKFGTLKFKWNQKDIKLVFNIGRGRFRIEQ
ncbi:competence type IV pilus minor pilin ComGD [Heyndrickxia sp. NPDC080065]|uniref:competence type IV pilus minor pilin ComGD n=1 Tax=Heyndrickxia sp. NPDC080065 TaxID=3390568 RepID=UPI003D04FC73